jgi:hypothetical protein
VVHSVQLSLPITFTASNLSVCVYLWQKSSPDSVRHECSSMLSASRVGSAQLLPAPAISRMPSKCYAPSFGRRLADVGVGRDVVLSTAGGCQQAFARRRRRHWHRIAELKPRRGTCRRSDGCIWPLYPLVSTVSGACSLSGDGGVDCLCRCCA